ncbi:rho GTPase-activating protein 20-like isoform X1 [Dipodomys merriami]|uniref:rho GTPase-activating protein 20-like isoform X1 n=1 Tax=Dipodomys merriami TaxID=94247 RepID=UPI0038556EB0
MSAVQSHEMDKDKCSLQSPHTPCAASLHEQESHLPEEDAQQDTPVSLEDNDRALLIHSPVQMRRGWSRKKRHLFLFSNVLLVSNTKYKKCFKIKDAIPLHNLSMAECGDKVANDDGSSTKSFVLIWPKEKYKVTFRSSELKETWCSLLQSNIQKQKELQKCNPLQNFPNDFQKAGSLESHHAEQKSQQDRPLSLEKPCRTLLIHSPVQMQKGCKRKKQHLFLFTDLLLVTNAKYQKCFKIKTVVPLRALWMADCGVNLDKGGDHSRKSFLLGWPLENFMATFGSCEQKEKWITFLQRYINLAKEEEDEDSIPLQIFTHEVKNNHFPITVLAKNSDTVKDVISKTLSTLGKKSSECDYQLWLHSENKEAPFVFIGHENPYVIKKSQFGETAFQPRGPRPHEIHTPQNPILEQCSLATGGRFILKPRQPAQGQQLNESEQKKEGRGRSFINWLFGQRSSTAKENRPLKSSSAKRKLLFGTSLEAACKDGKLPSPLLEMISFLSQEGRLTEGIFRKSGSINAVRALKEKLMSGAPLDLHQESVFVVASVLKDFLRNVQGGVFYTGMYETWLRIMDEDREEEKIILAQSLLEMLPRGNQLLLKHLFGMLSQIHQNSSLNLMTSYNLAVSTATSLMFPPPDARVGFDIPLMRKVALVQFLIENAHKIFAKDFTPVS